MVSLIIGGFEVVFDTEDQYYFWLDEARAIRADIADINDDGNPGAPRVPRYREWLGRVTAFQNRWGGKSFVPHDIRNAVNSVERGIGAEVTQWPQWGRHNDNA